MKVAAIIVTYHPGMAALQTLLNLIQHQVQAIYVIDNSPQPLDLSRFSQNFAYTHLADNPGIAAAQNTGLLEAIDQHMTHVLLLDQDSEPAPDMVSRLLDVLTLRDQPRKIAAVGPMYVDRNSGKHSTFLTIGTLKNQLIEFDPDDPDKVVDTDFLIASGCLIPVDVITDVGLMDESLFIDYVDTEWGLRATQRGYCIKGVCGNLMFHRMGEASHNVWLGRWRQVAIHKSFRYYYIFRNCLILFSRPESTFKWKLFHIKRLLMLLIFISWSRHAPGNLRFAIRGIRDALLGKSGPMLKT